MTREMRTSTKGIEYPRVPSVMHPIASSMRLGRIARWPQVLTPNAQIFDCLARWPQVLTPNAQIFDCLARWPPVLIPNSQTFDCLARSPPVLIPGETYSCQCIIRLGISELGTKNLLSSLQIYICRAPCLQES
jgi:hypothetical protein